MDSELGSTSGNWKRQQGCEVQFLVYNKEWSECSVCAKVMGTESWHTKLIVDGCWQMADVYSKTATSGLLTGPVIPITQAAKEAQLQVQGQPEQLCETT